MQRTPASLWRAFSTTTAIETIVKRKNQSKSRLHFQVRELDRVLKALQAFRIAHGHSIVPPRFIIPASDQDQAPWPSDLQGLKLGSRLQRLYTAAQCPGSEEIREQLRDVGVQVQDDEQDYKAFYWQATILAALRTYQQLHGDLYVPRPFVVPADNDATTMSPWPMATWGLRLGQQVHLLRKKAAEDVDSVPEYQREALEAMDFAWDVSEHKWTTRFFPALTRFHKLHGHSNVPQKFTVPTPTSTNQAAFTNWKDLPQCHGYRLGSAVNKVRRGDSFTAQIVRYFDDLEELGFTFSSFDRNWSDKVLPALETFYDIYGHTHVDAYFEVPEHDKRWPPATWGMGLGFIVQNIRSRGDFFPQIMRDGDRLEAIEFVWNRAEVKWKQMVLPALETFVAIHKHARVPASFIVPPESPWPRDAHHLRLGRIVAIPSARNRFANFIEIDRKRLEDIGFHWSVMETTNDDTIDEDSDEESHHEM